MMRYIDADALIGDVTERYCKDCDRRKGIKNGVIKTLYEIGEAPCRACSLDDMIDTLENAPTVDAEPVIRCKDCKYFDHSDFGKGEEYWCKHFVSTDDYTRCHKVVEDDFCAWGERKSGQRVDKSLDGITEKQG